MDKHPISASASGQNAYYLGNCQHVEHNPPYAACLDKIKRLNAGQKGVPTCCADAIKHGTCQAADMRKTEELAGHALYFVPREKLEQGLAKAPPWSVPGTKSPVTKENQRLVPELTASQRKLHSGTVSGAFSVAATAGTYADAINAAMQETAPATVVSPEQAARDEVEKFVGKESLGLYTAIAESGKFTKEEAHKAFAQLAPAPTPAPPPSPAPTPAPSAFARFKSRPQPLPGESPIAYAKRCAAHKESQ